MDNSVPILGVDADLTDVVKALAGNDVVLVVGHDYRLQGIVTAWDLAEEFAELVDPFKRIGEVEMRLRALLDAKLGPQRIQDFKTRLTPSNVGSEANEGLTIGDLQRICEHPDNWKELGLTAYDKSEFVGALERMRVFRNRLMHFRDPLNEEEIRQLTYFCDLIREIRF